MQGYFATEDISAQFHSQFPQMDASLLAVLKNLHQQLAFALKNIKDDAVKLITVKNHFYKLQDQQRTFQKEAVALETQLRNMPADWNQRSVRQARLDMLKTRA